MRAVLIGLCLLSGFIGTAQTASVPTVILDSLIFEVKLGRQCSEVIKAQAVEIEKQGKELVATGKALELSQSSNSTLSSLLNNSREANVVQAMQFQKDISQERKKTKRWRRIGIIQAAVILTIILTPSL